VPVDDKDVRTKPLEQVLHVISVEHILQPDPHLLQDPSLVKK
jgi:hypothetical protein